ncbi:corrinoid protein [candidate division WOR-3 bacterium]|nr:corrinoid protein [candidate division WOR-3 bacterium]
MGILQAIARALEQGDCPAVSELVAQGLTEQKKPKEILDQGLIAGMNVIGEKYKNHEIFLPDVLLAAKAMYAGMDILKPLFLKGEMASLGRVVIGTVQGDIHDIGKNLVGIMLRGAGFDVIDLGKDVAPAVFVETALRENARVIGMSALLTTTMPVMREVTALLARQGLQGKIKTVIGGAPVSDEFARQIGADGYGYDSVRAVECIKQLISEA